MILYPAMHAIQIFILFEAACAVDEHAAIVQVGCRGIEDPYLDIRHLLYAFGGYSPPGIGSALEDPRVGAGDIQKNTVKFHLWHLFGAGGISLVQFNDGGLHAFDILGHALQAVAMSIQRENLALIVHSIRTYECFFSWGRTCIQHLHARLRV